MIFLGKLTNLSTWIQSILTRTNAWYLWGAANATQSHVSMRWWTLDQVPGYQFQATQLPEPTAECRGVRIVHKIIVLKGGGGDNKAHRLQTLVTPSLRYDPTSQPWSRSESGSKLSWMLSFDAYDDYTRDFSGAWIRMLSIHWFGAEEMDASTGTFAHGPLAFGQCSRSFMTKSFCWLLFCHNMKIYRVEMSNVVARNSRFQQSLSIMIEVCMLGCWPTSTLSSCTSATATT